MKVRKAEEINVLSVTWGRIVPFKARVAGPPHAFEERSGEPGTANFKFQTTGAQIAVSFHVVKKAVRAGAAGP